MVPKLRLQVEGWRGISHSYALVNQFQLLAWASDPTIELGHVDTPYFFESWGKHKNPAGLTEKDQAIIDDLKPLPDFDALFRIHSPFNLTPVPGKRTGIFMVTEFGLDVTTVNLQATAALRDQGGFIATPSRWSQERLLANGIPGDILHVVPHSADVSYFHPLSPDIIAQQRKALGFNDNDVILLNVGTQHWAKGMDLLIRAFAIARQSRKNLRLILKDQRNTYTLNTEEFIYQTLRESKLLSDDVINAITMIPMNLSLHELNALYNVSDAYVSPYRAEGYNLPVHEAQQCHTPVIVTQEGATKDFVLSEHNHLIEGQLHTDARLKDEIPVNAYIEPRFDQLCEVLQIVGQKSTRPSQPALSTWQDCSKMLRDLMFTK